MGNPFMPSVAGSLNQAGQDTLLQLLQRRAFEEESMRRNVALQQNDMRNSFNVEMRLKDQQQQDRAHELRLRLANEDRDAAKAKADREGRDATNVAGLRSMFSEGLTRGASREDLLPLAVEAGGKIPVSLLPKTPETPKRTDDEEIAWLIRKREAEKGVDAKFDKPKPTKVAKDTPGAPNSFRAAISGRKGTKGYTKAKEAFESVTARWQDWRRDYPNLDMSQVKSAIENVYGEDIPSAGAGVADYKARLEARLGVAPKKK
jgi:hypothetical protein